MQVRGQRGYMFDLCIATVVEAIVAPAHRHGVIQLFVSLDGQRCSAGPTLDDQREGYAHLIAANQPHAVRGLDGIQVVVLLPQEAAISRRLTAEYLTDEQRFAVIPKDVLDGLPLATVRRAYEEEWSAPEFRPVIETFLTGLGRNVPDAPIAFHPAVLRAVRTVSALEQKRISADELSERVGLSKSHFLRTFSENMGIPLRPYLQWLRLMDAFMLLADGTSVTDAAVEAGFTDAAHLNRVTQRAFAMNPSELSRMKRTFLFDQSFSG